MAVMVTGFRFAYIRIYIITRFAGDVTVFCLVAVQNKNDLSQ